MAMSLRSFGAAKVFLGLLGMAVFTSLAVGGWTLWSRLDAAANDQIWQTGTAARLQAKPEIVTATPIAPTETPIIVADVPAEPESAKVVGDKTKGPTGRKHERQETLLEVVMQRLHSEAYEYFIRQPGMGVSRLKPVVTFVKRDWKNPDWTSEELAKEPPPFYGMKDLGLLHRYSVRTFAESNIMTQEERWASLVKDPPEKKDHLWEIKSLDLVGLVMHDPPVVYVSEKLPQMKDLKNTPTRDLDLFESEGLEELLTGKPLYVRSKHDTIRVLGPIQAGNACLKCHHNSKEGDVLGAFSYTLREGDYMMFGRRSKTGPALDALKNSLNKSN